MKQCSKCGETKDLTRFRKGRGKNNLRAQCRDCENAYKRSRWVSKGKTKTQLLQERLALQKERDQKYCKKCNEWLDFSDFYKDKKRADGLTLVCRYCHAESYYLKNFNLTASEAKKLLTSKKECEICSKKFENTKEKHIDHCHETGEIRGILCSNCNTGLGLFKDNIKLLEIAQEYLKKNGKN